MALTPGTVTRAVDASGDDIRTFSDGGVLVPGAAIVGDSGEHIGRQAAPLIAEPRALTRSATGGTLEAKHNAKNAAGTFFFAKVTVDATVVVPVYLMLFDLAAPPTGGEVPLMRAGLDPTSYIYTFEFDAPGGLACASGIQLALSTTLNVLTLYGSNVAAFEAWFL